MSTDPAAMDDIILIRYETWLSRIPLFERDMPYCTIQDETLTPREMVEHVRENTEIGEVLRAMEYKFLTWLQER